jgi:FMN-dependent NADH-azoreductase
MTTILVIDSSPQLRGSYSRRLVQSSIDLLASEFPHVLIVRRDLGASPPPHLDGATISAMRAALPAELSVEQRAALAVSDLLVDELLSADGVIIGSPMHNFGIPSVLKAYIDHIARAGRTFRYGTDGRPVGLLTNRTALIITARGGVYTQGPMAAFDFQESYLRAVLGFLGMKTEFIHVEGVAMSPDAAAMAVASAERALLKSSLAGMRGSQALVAPN